MKFTDPLVWLLVVINIPVYWILGRVIFGGWQGLGDSIRQGAEFDTISFIKGNLLGDLWHTAKILVFLFCCYQSVAYEYRFLFQ